MTPVALISPSGASVTVPAALEAKFLADGYRKPTAKTLKARGSKQIGRRRSCGQVLMM
ncbi:hypothetical protein ACTOVL_05930 [Arcanobacterium canis]